MNGRELNANVVLVKLNGKEMYSIRGRVYTLRASALGGDRTGGLKLDKDGGSWYKRRFPTATSRISNEVPI